MAPLCATFAMQLAMHVGKGSSRSQTKVPSATVGEQVPRQPVHLIKEDTVAAPQEYTLYLSRTQP